MSINSKEILEKDIDNLIQVQENIEASKIRTNKQRQSNKKNNSKPNSLNTSVEF